jgi:hypothetical protein
MEEGSRNRIEREREIDQINHNKGSKIRKVVMKVGIQDHLAVLLYVGMDGCKSDNKGCNDEGKCNQLCKCRQDPLLTDAGYLPHLERYNDVGQSHTVKTQ